MFSDSPLPVSGYLDGWACSDDQKENQLASFKVTLQPTDGSDWMVPGWREVKSTKSIVIFFPIVYIISDQNMNMWKDAGGSGTGA